MSPTRLLLLLLLMLGLAAGLHWLGRRAAAPPEVRLPEPAARPLLPGRPEDVVRLTVHYPEQEGYLRLEREAGGDWRLTEPIIDRAEPEAVRVALAFLFGAEWTLAPAAWRARAAADLGLDPPRLVVQVDFDDGQRHVLRLGARAAAGEWYAAERDGQRLLLAARALRVLGRPFQEWRDHRVLARPGSVRRLSWRPPGGEDGWVLERAGERWRLAAPVAAPLSPLARSGVARLLGARIEELRDDALTPVQRQRLAAAGTLVAEGGGRRQVLHLDDGQGWLEGRPYLLALDPGDFRLLGMTLDELRSHRLLDLEPGEVVSLRLERGDRRLDLRRRGKGWAVVGGPVLDPGDPETAGWQRTVEELVRRLCTLETKDRALRGGEGGAPPAGSVLLSRSPRPVERGGVRVWWWRMDGGGCRVATAPRGGRIWQVPDLDLDGTAAALLEALGVPGGEH